MGIKEKLLSILAGIGALFSAIFYVLFLQKKQENMEEKNAQLLKELEIKKDESDEIKQMGKKYRKNLQDSANNINDCIRGDVSAGVELMHKLTENGKRRNKEN